MICHVVSVALPCMPCEVEERFAYAARAAAGIMKLGNMLKILMMTLKKKWRMFP